MWPISLGKGLRVVSVPPLTEAEFNTESSSILTTYRAFLSLRELDSLLDAKAKLQADIESVSSLVGSLKKTKLELHYSIDVAQIGKIISTLQACEMALNCQVEIISSLHQKQKKQAIKNPSLLQKGLIGIEWEHARKGNLLEDYCLYRLSKLFEGWDDKHAGEPSWKRMLQFLSENRLTSDTKLREVRSEDQLRKRVARFKEVLKKFSKLDP
ncbi:MAG: hypothetical protein AB7F66_04655 [Bacteriovoracia bacterium]